MARYLPEPPFRHDMQARDGILLLNLGTPEAPTAAAVRPYLREFLSDTRVVEIPRALWWLILNGAILPFRPARSAAKYAEIWTAEGSPLMVNTRRQRDALATALAARGRDVEVEFAMRYGKPDVAGAIARLKARGVDRLLVLPLYPQYAGSSGASALDAVFRTMLRLRNMPALRTIRNFHDDPGYIGALAARIRADWEHNGRPDVLVMSFHGVPRYTLDKGDPYHCECLKTGRLLAEALGLEADAYKVTFQSRFGRAEWIKPYTAEVLAELGRAGTRRVDVVCPGFVSDCLETLEEIAMEGRETFLAAGGGACRYLPCLNDSPEWIAALADLAEQHLWQPRPPADASARAARARAAGAGDTAS